MPETADSSESVFCYTDVSAGSGTTGGMKKRVLRCRFFRSAIPRYAGFQMDSLQRLFYAVLRKNRFLYPVSFL